jgi:hypothetical protein
MPEQMTAEMPRFALSRSSSTDVSYWIDGELEISVSGPNGTRQVRIGRPCALVGSSPGCDIVLPEGSAPEKAVYLHATRHGIFFVDLSPDPSATEVRRGWLDQEDWVMGSFRVSARLAPAPSLDTAGRCDLLAPATLNGKRPVIEVSDGERSARVQLSRRLAIIGRSHPSTLRIKNRIVSAIHAALFVDQDRLWIIDLDSTNGVRSDSARVTIASLGPGEMISVGGPTLALERFYSNFQASAPPGDGHSLSEVHAFHESDPPRQGSFSLRDTDPVPDQGQSTQDDLIDPSLGRLMLRENIRRKRRRIALAAIAAVVLIALGSTGFWAWRQYVAATAVIQEQGSAVDPLSGDPHAMPDIDDLGIH